MKKTHLTLKKLPQKVSRRFIVALGVLNSISKVLPKSDHAKRIIFKMASKMAARFLKFQLFAHQSYEMTHFDTLSLVLSLIWYIMYLTHTTVKI